MAKPIEIRPGTGLTAEDARRLTERAKEEHSEALLDAYRTLQALHDTRSFDVVRGMLGAGGTVIKEVTDVITTPSSVRSIRNVLILSNLLGSLDPDGLHGVTQNVTKAAAKRRCEVKPPALWRSLLRIFSKDTRRAIALGFDTLEAVGRVAGPKTQESTSES